MRRTIAMADTVLYVRSDDGCAAAATALTDMGYEVVATGMSDATRCMGSAALALVVVEYSVAALDWIRSLHRARPDGQTWVPLIACCPDWQSIEAAIEAGADDFLVSSDARTIRSRLSVLLRQKARNDMLQGVLNATFDGIVTIDPQGRILTFNKAATEIFGYTVPEVLGRNVSVLMPEPERSQHDAHMQRYQTTGQARIIGVGRDVVGRRKNGETFPLFLQISATRVGPDHVFVGVLKDRSVEARATLLQHEATHDAVTGLANRRQIQRVLEQWTRVPAGGVPRVFAVLFIDVDDFKSINDRWGHAAGDAVLKATAGRLQHGVSSRDVVGRLAGDEFVVLLDRISQHSEAQVIAQRLLAHFSAPIALADDKIVVSASIGIALHPQHATAPDALLQRADAAMYAAKRAGPR